MKSATERSILVVDDEEEVRAALSVLLSRDGYQVHLAENAEQGLRALRERPIHLVIADHNMPDMKGIHFLKLVRERHPEAMRMMLSGDPDGSVILRSIKEGGVFWFLRKPWDNTVLRVTVYLALQRHEVEEQNRRLQGALRRQLTFLGELESSLPEHAARLRAEQAVLRTAAGDPVQGPEPARRPRP